jgi:hypothetical protein
MTRRKSIPAKPNPGAPKPAHVRAEALRLRRSGMPATQIAAKLRRQFGIKLAKATVQLWGDEADAEAAPAAYAGAAPVALPDVELAGPLTPRMAWPRDVAPAQPVPAEAPADAAPAELDALGDDPTGLETMRALVREQRALATMARRDGNAAAAAKALKAAGDAAEAVARLSARQVAGGEGALVLTKEQVAQVRAAARQLEEKYASDLQRTGGPVCAECGRRLRIELASRPGDAPTLAH